MKGTWRVMKYKINEIFYSIQGEGYFTGVPAIFIRFSGCNLDCPWCDTKYHKQGLFYTKEEIEGKVEKLFPCKTHESPMIVFTGGEPTLQLKEDEELLPGYFRAVETNGLKAIPSWVDWITLSPKTDIILEDLPPGSYPDEVKVVYEKGRDGYLKYLEKKYIDAERKLFLQPLEKDGKMNIEETVEFIKKYPTFRLSVQLHKLIGVK